MKKILHLLIFNFILLNSFLIKAQIKLDTGFNCLIPKLETCTTCLPYATNVIQLQDKSVIALIKYIAIQAPFKNFNYLLKFNAKGEIINTFGNNGKLDINASDKIFADGNDFYTFSDSNLSNTFIIKKFDMNGSPVSTWCNNGVFEKTHPNKSVIINDIWVSNGSVFATYAIIFNGGFNNEVAISKIKNNVLDVSFGINGTKTLFLDSAASIRKIIEKKNGKLLIAVFANYKIRIVQLNSDGSIDVQFGNNGILYPSADFDTETPKDIVEDNNGNIFMLADYLKNGSESEILIAKYSASGLTDANFGANGRISYSCENKSNDIASNLMLQSDGTIISLATYESNNKATFSHFDASGQAINSFNLNANTNLVNNAIYSSKTGNTVYVFGNGIQKYIYNGNHSTHFSNSNLLNTLIQIFPNPTSSELNIHLPSEIESAYLTITDFMGKIICTYTINNRNNIDLSHLKAGIYLVNIATEKETVNFKIVKQ